MYSINSLYCVQIYNRNLRETGDIFLNGDNIVKCLRSCTGYHLQRYLLQFGKMLKLPLSLHALLYELRCVYCLKAELRDEIIP